MRQLPPAHTPIPPIALARLALPAGAADDGLRTLLGKRCGVERMVLVGSGTQALTLGIAALAGPEGAVALPGWGCFDLASAAVGAGVGVHLYDLDPITLQPDPASLARAIQAGATVGVVVSFFGIPVDPAVLPQTAGVAWIHDAAQAHGADFDAASIEGRVDATVLSFGRGKGWTGLGGGALLLRSERARVGAESTVLQPPAGRRLGSGVRGAAQWLLGRPALYGLPARIPGLGLGETHYHPPQPVQHLAPVSASVLLATRAAADAEAETRRRRAGELRSTLAALRQTRVVDPIEVGPMGAVGYLRFPVLDRGSADRTAGVALGVLPSYPISLDVLDALKPLLRHADALPGSRRLAQQLLTLPTHSLASPRDRARLEAWLVAPNPQ